MANITKVKQDSDVQLHIELAFKIIDADLPQFYVDLVQEILPNATSSVIRNVRNRTNAKLESKLPIINALVEVAKKNKLAKEKLRESVSSTT